MIRTLCVLIGWMGIGYQLVNAAWISGSVVDGQVGMPLEYVNVVGMDADSVFVAGTVTDSVGTFRLDDQRIRLLGFNIVGYERHTVAVHPDCAEPLSIALTPFEAMLGEVEVTASKSRTRLIDGEMVTAVAGTPLADMMDVYDMFRFIPMVSVQGDEITVFGKGTPLYYINNRKVRNLNELRLLRPSDILSVKVITNPGALYSSSASCIIVISIRKAAGEGFSGSVLENLSGLKRFSNGLSATLRYRRGGLEVFGDLYYGYNNLRNTIAYQSEIFTTIPKQEDYITRYGSKGHYAQGKVGFSYDFSSNHSIGGYYLFLGGYSNTYSEAETSLATALSSDNWQEDEVGRYHTMPYNAASIYYEGKIGGITLSANVDYLGYDTDYDNNYHEYGGTISPRLFTTNATTSSKLYAEKLTATYPTGNATLAVGEEVTASRYVSDMNGTGDVVPETDTRTDETAVALFASWRHSAGLFNWEAGVRYEHRRTRYDAEGGVSQRDVNNDIFPTFNLGATHGAFSWNLGYSYRLSRPSFSQLSGNMIYMNRYTYQSGDPNLRPMKLQQLSLSAQYRNFWLWSAFDHRVDQAIHTSDVFGDVGDLILQHWMNFPPANIIQLSVGYQTTLRRWNPSISVNFYKQHIKVQFHESLLIMEKPRWTFVFNNQFSLPYDFSLYANYSYTSSGDIEITRYSDCHDLTLGLSKSFLQGNLTFQLWAYDIFNQQKSPYRKYEPAIYKQGWTDRERRQISIKVRYQFNATRSRYKGQGAGQAEKQRL